MSKYRKIDVRIWNDAKFRELSNNAKLVFFLLLTHPNMTALGAMRSTLAGLAEELNMDSEAFREAFREAFQKGMVKHDAKACLIVLPNFIKYNQPESPNVVKAWANSLDLLPECQLKNEVISLSANALKGYSKAFREALPEAFNKALLKGMPNQEQEQEQEHLNKNNTREDEKNKNEQAVIDELTKDSRKFFSITFDWKPNDSQFAAYCQRKLITPNQLTKEIFDKFVDKTTAKGEVKTEAQWCELLASYLKTCLDNPIPKKPNPHIYQPERTNQEANQSVHEPVYKPFEPLSEEEKTKTPLDALEKMRQKLIGAA